MRLTYRYNEIAHLLGQSASSSEEIHAVAYDSRAIIEGNHLLFFAFVGQFRDGHAFITDAYEKGVRHFVVKKDFQSSFPDAHFIRVEDPLQSLLAFATHHRMCFNYPVIAVTGSSGKTTVKEWLSELLSPTLNVVRSPKSYNSRLGVALSILEMHSAADVAIIEAGISEPGDMKILQEMIQPTEGIFTSFGRAHRSNFESETAHLKEKLLLFSGLESFFYAASIHADIENGIAVHPDQYTAFFEAFSTDQVVRQNASLAIAMSQKLGLSDAEILTSMQKIRPLALRLELFDGKDNSLIINDSYSLDIDSLHHALQFQMANCKDKKRIVVLGVSQENGRYSQELTDIVDSYHPSACIVLKKGESLELDVTDSCVLFKGERSVQLEKIAHTYRVHRHQTYLEIDLSAIRHNIGQYKSKLKPETMLLSMVKASSYGSDAKKMGLFLEKIGVNYFGVAYPYEGIELRKSGVKLPILVMNCESQDFESCIEYQLEPAIYSMRQLEDFIASLIHLGITNYPVHIKLETGMQRLGFEEDQIHSLIQKIHSQPEVRVKSIYSHLAESDVPNSEFTTHQIALFDRISKQLMNALPYSVLRHLSNSEGVPNYPAAQFDMVRLGIGMYGITGSASLKETLKPAIRWMSSISQVKQLTKGTSVGYNRTFIAEKDTQIAVVPVGYADGLSRALSRGNGHVFIGNHPCDIVGNVCMDMIMIDTSGVNAKEGDSVEIIGFNQPIEALAKAMNTIPYEVMTRFSPRLHRVFIEH